MQIPLLADICIIFVLSVGVLFLCHQIRLPSIVGFLLTGVIAGPHGLGLVNAVHEVETLAEIGVVLLLFTIGIEFSLEKLLQMKKTVLVGGSLQVFLTILAVSVIMWRVGTRVNESIFIGCLAAVSSTAIMLKLFQERDETNSPHGRTSLGISIFQDLGTVPMMLFTPLLAGKAANVGGTLLLLFAKVIGIMFIVYLSARWIAPQVLYQVLRTRSRELFLLSVLAICLIIVGLTSWAGLSLALGAFLAGLIVSESEYSHEALGHVSPFRDGFASFFFVSVGMLMDFTLLFKQPALIALLTVTVLLVKGVVAAAAAVSLRFPLRTAIFVGLALSPISEFSFILSRAGVEHGLLGSGNYGLFLVISVLTMAATPFIMNAAPYIADAVIKLPWAKGLKSGIETAEQSPHSDKNDHVIIIGFGVNGRNVARAVKTAGIPYEIVEMNPDTVRQERAKGEPIFYGDATHDVVLKHAGVETARVVVEAISDPAATRRITARARCLNPIVHIIVRTRYISEMKPLYEDGANEVIPEEFETSVEIFTRVLMKYLIPRGEVERFIAEVRADGYEMFRSLSKEVASASDLKLNLPDVEIVLLEVGQDSSFVGKSLAEIGLRTKYGVTMLAIRRNNRLLTNPHGQTGIEASDTLYLLGAPDKIAEVASLLSPPNPPKE